jgi:hypothetical protein
VPRPGALVAALILAVALPVVVPAPSVAAATTRRVLVYGDSVVDSASGALAERLARDGWAPQVVSFPGVDIEQVAATAMAEPNLGDVVVLGVGYTYFWKPFVLRRQVDALMHVLTARGVRRVIWLNVRENRAERRDVNEALASAARRWPTIDIADWDRFSRRHTEAFEPDGYHLEAAGGRLMGDLMARRLAAYRAGSPRSTGPAYGRRNAIRAVVASYGRPQAAVLATQAAAIVRRSPFVAIASTPSGNGYWLAHRNGGVEARGDARVYGAVAARGERAAPVVGVAATRSGRGYWLAASDGTVFAFGDARFYGSTRAMHLTAPIVALTATRSGRGYWLVAADGGVFSFGDARFYGSTGGLALAQPIVGIAPHPGGRGYWLVAYDGGIFAFGAARFHGSAATGYRYWKIEGVAAARDGKGYTMLAACGDVISFGSAQLQKTVRSMDQLFVAIAPRAGGGLFVLGQGPARAHA